MKRLCYALSTCLLFAPFVSNLCAQAPGLGSISFASNKAGDFDIYIRDTDGENLRNLTNDPARELDLAWSPDGRFLAYVSNRNGDFKIYVMDTRTREHWRLTHRHEPEWAPAWAPDGKWIAFVSGGHENPPFGKIRSHIYKTSVNGADLVQLTDRGINGSPAWAPDSQWIAFISYHRGDERKGVYVMAADGRKLKRIDDKEVQALNGIFQNECAWAPNGEQIVFSIVVPRENRMHLCVIDIDGKNFRQLTQGPPILGNKDNFPFPEIREPAWSPDGKWIAYVFAKTFGTTDIYVIDAMGNGRGKPLVKERGQDLSPAWVPAGFLSVFPSAEQQTTLWGRLKQETN